MNYLVTGLPRSRTLWMSRFLPNCTHEVAHTLDGLDELRHIQTGISDSGLGFFLEWILHELRIPVLVIDRDREAVENSLLAMGLNLPMTNYCDLLYAQLNKSKEHPLVLWMPFEQLDARMEEVCKHLNLPYDRERHEQMRQQEIALETDALKLHIVGNLFRNEIFPQIKLRGNENVHAYPATC